MHIGAHMHHKLWWTQADSQMVRGHAQSTVHHCCFPGATEVHHHRQNAATAPQWDSLLVGSILGATTVAAAVGLEVAWSSGA